MKIAIVDDEILVRVGIRSIIEWEKHDCCIIWEAGSGAEALEKMCIRDRFSADLGFANGVHIFVEVGTSNFINLPRWYILGQNGTAVIENWDLDGKLVCASGKDETDVVPVKTAAGLTKTMAPRREDTIHTEPLPVVKSDIRDFYRNVMAVLDGKEEPNIKLPEVMRVMKLMEAIFESAETHAVIPFEE